VSPGDERILDAAERWRSAVAGLRTWQKRGQRAVHKPLLTLMLIGRAERGDPAAVAFEEIEDPLVALLAEFGPPRKSHHPEYPFWHLRNDGFWITDDDTLPLKKGGHSPTKTTLREHDAIGRVPDGMWRALVEDPSLRTELASTLLEEYWPATYHEDIRSAIGIPNAPPQRRTTTRAVRDPAFRETVLRAYERQCAICGFDGRLGRDDLALEAAHVRWHCYDGPDELENGLALCTLHHTALDRGAVGLTPDARVRVSADVHGNETVEWLLLRFSGRPVRAPQRGLPRPAGAHIDWHAREVFRDPARRPA